MAQSGFKGERAMRALLLAGVVAIGWVAGAQALTASGGSISFTSLTDYYQQIGNLSYFNPDAGTLTAVTFTAGYGFDSIIMITASTPASGNASTESAANFQTNAPGIQAILNTLINNKPVAIIGSYPLNPTAYDYTGNKSNFQITTTSGPQTVTSNSAKTSVDYSVSPSNFDAFYYTGAAPAIDIYGQALTGLNLQSTGGNATATQSTTATQTISLLYTYMEAGASPTTIPEPASLALLGIGAAGIIAARRRRAA